MYIHNKASSHGLTSTRTAPAGGHAPTPEELAQLRQIMSTLGGAQSARPGNSCTSHVHNRDLIELLRQISCCKTSSRPPISSRSSAPTPSSSPRSFRTSRQTCRWTLRSRSSSRSSHRHSSAPPSAASTSRSRRGRCRASYARSGCRRRQAMASTRSCARSRTRRTASGETTWKQTREMK